MAHKSHKEIGRLVGTTILGCKNLYQDANGLYIRKDVTGMCGPEHVNVYITYADIVEVDGYAYKCMLYDRTEIIRGTTVG
jgi:hypothetical protein